MSARKKIAAIASGLVLTLGGCSTAMTTKDYAANTPKLDIRDYLNGNLEASGILFDYSGKADLFFTVKMVGSWQGNIGTLKEDFVYSDGRKDQRTWTITFRDDRTFTATAHDVVGIAKGTQDGNAVNMNYVLDAKRANGETIRLTMDDWLFLMDEKTLINRTSMKKYNITVGELVITFKKL
jgi:hypothetical protein